MKIAYIVTNLRQSGGLQAWVEHATIQLLERNYPVLVICENSPHERVLRMREVGATVEAYDFPGSIERYQQIITEFGADLIHLHVWKRHRDLLKLRKGCNVPIVFHHHSTRHAGRRLWLNRFTQFNKADWFLNDLFSIYDLRLIDFHLCCSEYVQKNIKSRMWPLKINTDILRNAIPNRACVTDEILQGPPKFIQVASLYDVKNPMMTLRAFSKVRKIVPEASLTFVGDGHLLNDLVKYVNNENIEGIEFVGTTKNTEKYFLKHNIKLLPSSSEGLPYALIESSAHGIPAIATNVGGVSEIISHQKSGLLFALHDEKKFAEYMIQLALEPSTRIRMGKEARNIFLTNFTCDKFSMDLVKFYKKAISN